jgi:hypothetical protein
MKICELMYQVLSIPQNVSAAGETPPASSSAQSVQEYPKKGCREKVSQSVPKSEQSRNPHRWP